MEYTYRLKPTIRHALRAAALSVMLLSAIALFHQHARAETSEGGSATATKDEFLEWIKRDAIHIERREMNPRLSRFLDTALEGKRILFIGEPGHFFSEKYDVQLMLIRYLAKKGYRHIFLEGLGASMAPAIDQLVSTGKKPGATGGKESADVARYRKRAFTGWVGAKDPEFKKRQSASAKRFYRELHRISESLPDGQGPLRIHPIDIDMMPGGCYHSIATLLEQYSEQKALDPVRGLAMRKVDETTEHEIKRLEQLNALLADPDNDRLDSMAPDERATLRTYADCLLETVVFFDTAKADGNLDRALVRREPAMFRQVKHAMDGIPADAQVMMLAHNNHLTKIGADTSRARDPSVGEMISQTYPGQVFSIWILHDHGTLLNPMSKELIDTLASDPLRIEATMIKAGSTYMLPLHFEHPGRRYIDRKRRYSYFTWDEIGTLTKQTDAIFFLDEISPLRK